ncbi:High-affinity zinc uptake system protein ZnuA precursor [Thalassovita gelatinovora]|uniref:High-affinity zinc uptake system protein ZnuA n=1 Tax=Thalassovita gelatinovora TaxID=53501 RepID=A0A0P1FGW6_THAGE|nr:zinc ABC transporter substrate-binding protein [Thalassovita gelatinovora]QIZ81873.1 zinc ABC transporter solute-binding protein [Thalassovita gelatinovora]CUH67200.1 High-affinity zinc uptake system protein ZnuA precursor [Thalassovita gelatinovora]SEP78621.1 zinc transport system substrate-binding protein [Thalassovita gelatinovora]
MSRILASLSAVAALMGGTAMAEVPNVVADIAPVHSLVARVMEGVGTPDLILPPGASPHEYSLRPSEAGALQDADVVVWTGARLAPWMEGAVETLAEDSGVLTLLEADETKLLDSRQNALFEKHSHGHDEEPGEEEHDHEDHAEGEHAHEDEHDHANGKYDAHAWLSSENAATWLNLIAAELSSADPDNAGTYFANAAAGREELKGLKSEVNATLDPVRGGSFIVFHDAFQYFEADFDFPASGAISLSDAQDPSPARIAEIQKRVRDEGIDCVLAEPQFNPDLVATVLDGTEAKTGVIDPLGIDLEPGSALYPQLIRNIAATLADCL